MSWDAANLSDAQAKFVEQRIGTPAVVADLSWGLVDTRVLLVRSREAEFIIKAAGADNHHIHREITAHKGWTGPLLRDDRAGRLIAASSPLSVLILEYQPGHLVEGTPAESTVGVHEQAGGALRLLHDQDARIDEGYEDRATRKAFSWLDKEHRIPRDTEAEIRRLLGRHPARPALLVPTHGDWHPRNWLLDDGRLRVIDFGRFDFRPAATDLCRLATQQWRDRPDLADAFVSGYGSDPRDYHSWAMDLLREAIATAVWSFQVGDNTFEQQGHRLLREALDRF
ncbi:aminoglycoside phosphotransferase [Kocuria polaris]|nr:aminoglycoside phosphotransferase [Kocuria polaris]